MMIEILKSVALGVVEGITEFLPISSTGHLILINHWLSFGETFTKMFDVVIQLGAILAVVFYFWKQLWPFGGEELRRREIFSTWKKTLIGVLPAIVIGGLFGGLVEEKLFNPWVVACALVVGGLVLIVVDRKQNFYRFGSLKEIPVLTIFFIGLVQCLALVPGVSRAAATIVGAMLLGASRKVAVEFSFYLAIPTMVAASLYSVLKHGLAITGSEMSLLTIGFVVAFATAFLVIRFFMQYIQNHNFRAFGYYRIILGFLVVMYFLLTNYT